MLLPTLPPKWFREHIFQSRRQHPKTQREEWGLARAPGQPAAGPSCWDDMQGPKPSRAARWSPVSTDPHGHPPQPTLFFPIPVRHPSGRVAGPLHRHADTSVSGSPYQCVLGIQNLTERMEDPPPATDELSAGWSWGHRLIIRRRRIYSAFGVTLPRPAPLFFIRAPCFPG